MAASSDSQAKLNQARAHYQVLTRLIEDFIRVNYKVDANPDFWEEPLPAKGEIIVYAEALAEPPTETWGPIIGDVIHNLRSALDQIVWGLSVDFDPVGAPPDPIPFSNPWRSVAFPIRTRQAGWAEVLSKQLRMLDPKHHSTVEQLQPFMTDPSTPERAPLAVLEELWNIDKHRHLHLVNATIELADVLPVNPFPDLPDVGTFEVVSRRPAGPLKGRVEIGRARHVSVPGGILAMSVPQIMMDPRLAIYVAFEHGAPGYGEGLMPLLARLVTTVDHVIAVLR